MRAIRAKKCIVAARGPLIEDAVIVFNKGRVAEIGPHALILDSYSGPLEDLGDVVVAPPVINAHTHLELSHLRGRTTTGKGFTEWVKSLLPLAGEPLDETSLASAVAELAACGTLHTVDIGSRSVAQVARAMAGAGVGVTLGVEFFGHQGGFAWPECTQDLTDSDWGLVSAAGHALYSTAPDTLAAAKQWCSRNGRLFPMHLAEHEGELETIGTGRGEFADLLRVRVLPDDFSAPGMHPVAYADWLGLLDAETLAVHCVQVGEKEIRLLEERGASVCLCPRSNEFIGVGRAPWADLAASGVNLCLGTDSLSSNADLDLWKEAAAVAASGEVDMHDILAWMTVNPARLPGMEQGAGTLEPGAPAGYSIVPRELARLL